MQIYFILFFLLNGVGGGGRMLSNETPQRSRREFQVSNTVKDSTSSGDNSLSTRRRTGLRLCCLTVTIKDRW